VVLLIPLTWEYLLQHNWRIKRDVAWLGLIPASFLGFQLYLFRVTGDPMAMRHAQSGFGRDFAPPWQVAHEAVTALMGSLSPALFAHQVVDLALAVMFGGLVVLTWRLGRSSLAILATVLYLPMISTGLVFSGMPRLTLELFPAFIVAGQLFRHRVLFVSYLVVASALSAVLVSMFAMGLWVA
jgi:hypothetical protein